MIWNNSTIALLGFIGWTMTLIAFIAISRVVLVLNGRVQPNGFTPDNEGLSAFLQRLARAHANCVESFPIYGGLLIFALITGQTHITDPLAPLLLIARITQSCIHLSSNSNTATNLRFLAYLTQLVTAYYWVSALIVAAIT